MDEPGDDLCRVKGAEAQAIFLRNTSPRRWRRPPKTRKFAFSEGDRVEALRPLRGLSPAA
jgi:hypothetical protein